jgi:chromosome segregation ATPase
VVNPEDLAAARFKEIAKAREQIAKVEAALARSREKHEELRRKLTTAEVRDRERLGAALVDSKPEPDSEAEQVRAELARQEERTQALIAAKEAARRQIPRLVEEHRPAWLRQGYQALGKATSQYQDAILELEAAREAADDAATLLAWLHDGTGTNAANDSLGNRYGAEAVSFTKTLAVLREDCEYLAAHPGTTGDPVPEPRFELAWTDRR